MPSIHSERKGSQLESNSLRNLFNYKFCHNNKKNKSVTSRNKISSTNNIFSNSYNNSNERLIDFSAGITNNCDVQYEKCTDPEYLAGSRTLKSFQSGVVTNGTTSSIDSSKSIFNTLKHKFHHRKDTSTSRISDYTAKPLEQSGNKLRLRFLFKFRSRTTQARQCETVPDHLIDDNKSILHCTDIETNDCIIDEHKSRQKQQIDKQYEAILCRYNVDKPLKCVSRLDKIDLSTSLSKTSLSTVRIACLLNGYNRLKDNNEVAANRAHSQAKRSKDVFNFEPFHNIATRKGFSNCVNKVNSNVKLANSQIDSISAYSNDSLSNELLENGKVADNTTILKATNHFNRNYSDSQSQDMRSDNLLSEDVSDGRAFRKKVDMSATELENKCKQYEEILAECKESIPEDDQGSIQAAIGQSRLLISKKVQQFRKLCEDNITGPASSGDRITTNQDLAGFWDMLEMQIEQCRSTFRELDKLREATWITEGISSNQHSSFINDKDNSQSNVQKREIFTTYQSTGVTKKPPSTPESIKLRELIRQRRMQMKGHNLNNNNEIVNTCKSEDNNYTNNTCSSSNNVKLSCSLSNIDVMMEEL